VLSIDSIQVGHGSPYPQPLIAGLSLGVQPREAVGLRGPSGCGKTTLLRSIVGLIDPLGGEITLDGMSPEEWGWPNYRCRVMLVPQRPVVWEGTVLDNLFRPRVFRSSRMSYGQDEAISLLEQVGLAEQCRREATQLSEGERQRLCLVRALLMRPEYLLLDEPSSALDEGSTLRIETVLRQRMQADPGMGLLLATHDAALAGRLCSRVVDLTGYLLKEGVTNDV